MYYTDEVLSTDETLEVYGKATTKQEADLKAKVNAQQVADQKEAAGRELFKQHIPDDAKALIIATYEQDDCDLQTDYFATKTTQMVILGWSKHTRDLLSEMRKNFKFASNKLEWTSIQMGYEGKIQNRGFQLWLDCMNGDVSAWREMKSYNVQDVRLLEDMYDALLPWIKNHPNWGLYVDADKNRICTNCGSSKVKKNGFERTRVRTYRRYRCLRCGNPLRGRTQFHKTAKGVLT